MLNLAKSYKKYFNDKYFVWSSSFGLIFLIFGLATYYLSSIYATEKQSSSVTDIILSNIPVYNVADIFVYGFLVFLFLVFFLCLTKPKIIPFVLKSSAIFLIIRSIFVSLTHIGLYPNVVATNADVFKNITSGGDLFFSGHAGFPFLLALIFWQEKNLRYLFITISIFFSVIALLGHYHYTIDILAAYFITFSIYHICLKIFKRDYQIFLNDI